MMARRIMTPKARPGELKAVWGRQDRHSNPSVCYAWGGGGADKSDGRILSNALEGERFIPASLGTVIAGRKRLGEYETERSFVQELEARGYDITTLKFTIQKAVI